jgi:exodeoxyribonuclease I
MAKTFYFYDLETTGVSSRRSRIMQFAGQRTDENLNPIGEPHDILIRLTEDILPDPDAILLTGITPQKTLDEGITEAEFCKLFVSEIATPDTCFVGYNNVRFDDEFMRFLLYRNFYDPYSWQWKDGRSRWDLLDVVRMTRALRPGDIKWPYDEKGVCTNRLELLTKENNLLHDAAHDALSDVRATIAVADMVKSAQPKLFNYLYSIRNKRIFERSLSE